MIPRRAAIVLFCGDPARDERQKQLPPHFLRRLHRALIARLSSVEAELYVAHHDAVEFRIGDRAWPSRSLAMQLETALRFCFGRGHARVLLVAGDAALDPRVVRRAIEMREPVLAASGDGGFAIAGFSELPEIEWESVVADRSHAAARLRERVAMRELPRIDDIDSIEDARRIARLFTLIGSWLARALFVDAAIEVGWTIPCSIPARSPPA